MYDTGTTTTTTDAAVVLIALVLVLLVYGVPLLISMVRLYSKAGKPGWAAIVPVYSYMVMAEIGKQPLWLGITAGVTSVLSSVFAHPPVNDLLSTISLILFIILLVAMAKQYDRGPGFWWLLVLLPIVAVFQVGKVNYIGAAAGADTGNPTPPASPATPVPAPDAPVAPASDNPVSQ